MARSENIFKHRVGILGGTFDPVHFGHLLIAEKIRERFGLDKIYFIPAYQPPHKTRFPVADSYDRFTMLALATLSNRFFNVLSLELKKRDMSYTIDTLKALRKQNKREDYFFILGTDSFLEITTWKEYRNLVRRCHLIVVNREGYDFARAKTTLPGSLQKMVVHVENENRSFSKELEQRIKGRRKFIFYMYMDPVAISSSEIRGKMKNQESARYDMPDSVLAYIQKNKLYL